MVFLFRGTSCRFIWIGDGAMLVTMLLATGGWNKARSTRGWGNRSSCISMFLES